MFDARWQLAWLYWLRGRWDELQQLTDYRGQSPPRVSRLLLDLLRMQMEFARGRRPTELPAMRDAWGLDGMLGIYACGLNIEVAGRDGDPAGAVRWYDEGVALLSAIWHPGFGARVRLSATAIGVIADNLPDAPSSSARSWSRPPSGSAAEGHGARDNYQDPTGYWGPEGQAWVLRLDAERLRVRWLAGIDPARGGRAARGVAGHRAGVRRDRVRVRDGADPGRARRDPARLGRPGGRRPRARAGRGDGRPRSGPPRCWPGWASPNRHSSGDRRTYSESGGLTPRELEVLDLIAAGRSNSEIGQQLFISRKTASVHVSNILAKLGAATRTEAVALARRRGLSV